MQAASKFSYVFLILRVTLSALYMFFFSYLGKYCVRFGSNIKQFCSNKCLEDHKKGLKVCCYCQKDISAGDGFLAPIGNKGQFKDFCAQVCLKKYENKQFGKPIEKEVMNCAVCSNEKTVEAELILGSFL